MTQQSDRAYERQAIDVQAEISIKVLGSAKRYPIPRVIDISFGGIKVASTRPFETGSDVDLLLIFSDYKLKFIAQVKRCQESQGSFELGLEFITISQKNLKRLFELTKSPI